MCLFSGVEADLHQWGAMASVTRAKVLVGLACMVCYRCRLNNLTGVTLATAITWHGLLGLTCRCRSCRHSEYPLTGGAGMRLSSRLACHGLSASTHAKRIMTTLSCASRAGPSIRHKHYWMYRCRASVANQPLRAARELLMQEIWRFQVSFEVSC